MNDKRIISYEGNEPYIFISYCHKDSERIMPVLRHIQKDGYRIWYDDGTESGIEWAEAIEQHLVNASCMIAFITANYLKSDNCLDEIEHAKNKSIKILMIYLEDIKVPGWFEMRHNRTQAVLKSHYNSEESFYKRIYSAKMLYDSKQLNEIIKSSENDNINSQEEVEAIFHHNNSKFKIYYSESFKRYAMAAEADDAEAQYTLGKMYYLGQGVKENIEEAFYWFIKSAENGNADAQNWLGDSYYYGKGIAKDYEEAIKWYKIAAHQGNIFSIQMLKMLKEDEIFD